MKGETKKKILLALFIIGTFLMTTCMYVSCEQGCDNSHSSYQLYNKDGTINWKYYNDMQDYFAKHPEKLP